MLFFPLLLIEIIFRLISNINVFNFSFLRIFLAISIISMFLSLIISFISKKISNIISIIIIFVFSFYAFLELLFNNFLGVYMSFNTVSQAGAVKDYIKDFLKSMKGIYICIFIPFIILLVYFIINNVKNKNNSKDFKLKKTYNYEYQIITFIMLILTVLFSYSYYYTLDDKYNSDKLQAFNLKDLFLTASNPTLCVKDFGIISYGLIDAKTKLIGSNENELIFAYNDEIIEKDNTRDIDDTVWKEIIENETNKSLAKKLFPNKSDEEITSALKDIYLVEPIAIKSTVACNFCVTPFKEEDRRTLGINLTSSPCTSFILFITSSI